MWVCIPCGYLEENDDYNFKLPDDWVCPDCGAPREHFESINLRDPYVIPENFRYKWSDFESDDKLIFTQPKKKG